MPSTSQKQHNLMQLVVAGKSNAVPLKVAKEFLAKDKQAGKFQRGIRERLKNAKRKRVPKRKRQEAQVG